MSFKFFTFFIGFLFINIHSFSHNYSIVNIGTKGELKDNYVHSIYKDSEGFIWIGTSTTIERWDGTESIAYSFPENNQEYAPYLVHTILQQEPDVYWIGCKKGVWRLDLKKEIMEQTFSEQINFPVYALAREADILYMGTTNGLYVYDGDTLRHLAANNGTTSFTNNQITGIVPTGVNAVWLMFRDGLAVCNPQSEAIKVYPNTVAGCGNLLSIERTGQKLYIGTERGGIITFDLSHLEYSPFTEQIKAPVTALSQEDDLLAVATLGEGISIFSLSDSRQVNSFIYTPQINNGLLSNNYTSVLLTDGDIWCGMDYYAGMIHLRRKHTAFELFSTDGFNSEGMPVRTLFLNNDQCFISNRDGFMCIKEADNQIRYFNSKNVPEERLRSDLIFSFHLYRGYLLIGTYAGGISIMNPDTYNFIETPLTKSLNKNDIFMFLEDKEDNLWIAASDGLYSYNPHTQVIKEYNTFNCNLPGNMVYGIYIDSSDRFWIATNRGVCLFDPETEACNRDIIPEESILRNEPVRSIYEGRDGTLLFCILNIHKERTLLISDKNFTNFTYPLPIECYNITQDENGFYWAGSDQGIIKINEQITDFTLFTSADGIPEAPMSAGAPIVKDKEDRLWMANMQGVIIIDPKSVIPTSSMKITDVLINGKQAPANVLSGKSLTLKKRENNLEFRFISLGYENPEKLKYEFILEGYDDSWIRQDHKNRVSYYNLSPGNYTFRVRKLLTGDTITGISFKIENNFTGVFLLLFIPILLIGAILIGKNRLKAPPVISRNNQDSVLPEKYVKLSDKEAKEIIHALKVYMEKEKPFLNRNLKQSDLATGLGHSSYLLSAIFTHYLKTGYYDFINKYRIEEFKNRVKAEEHKKYTIFSLAQQCGFKSKASFFRVFKKITGLTPNEYIQQQEKSI